MPRTPKVPSYRRHKARNLAFALIGGKPRYLGRWNTPESKQEYARVIREWAVTQTLCTPARRPKGADPSTPPSDLTVSEMILGFLRHADRHYRDRDGNPTHEAENFKEALKPLRALYGPTLAAEFGPLALQAVRGQMVQSGLARTTVNARIGRVRRALRWAASMELIPGSVLHDLKAVAGLQKSRTDAREATPIDPVPIGRVEAVIPHFSGIVAAMIKVQLFSACRAGEVMSMRSRDVVQADGAVWEFKPHRHKGKWRKKQRVIPLGPKAVEALRPYLKPDTPDAYVFSPAEAATIARRTRDGADDAEGEKPSPKNPETKGTKRAFNARYRHRAYRLAVIRGCDRAFPHPTLSAIDPKKLTEAERSELAVWRKDHRFCPLQLRHAAATAIRAAHGLEAAQATLGHARADVTQIYAERDLTKAKNVAEAMG